MNVKIEKSWKQRLDTEFQKPYFSNLVSFITKEFSEKSIYPSGSLIFNAFNNCSFDDVKVVILGQDPYHGEGQAHGLSFSVPDGVKKPPSLKNIFKEIEYDLGIEAPDSGNLLRWANQGVLLLNSILTVQKGKPASHQMKGWEVFTDAVIDLLSKEKKNLVFMLWGAYAYKKGLKIDRNKHLVIETSHPSPFSADKGFFRSKQFSKCNDYLEFYKKGIINW
tara:strand:- start:1196 stop:1858 length:663 start_codon:yes stop_codon:yes gene_type:complete